MLKYKWTLQEIKTEQDLDNMIKLYRNVAPCHGAFDTETTGLHIIHDKPFVFQFGFVHPFNEYGWAFAVDIEKNKTLARSVIQIWNNLASALKRYAGHNIVYDLHMLQNIGLPYTTENVTDTRFYIRYSHDAVHQDEGGPPLSLKDYSARYIDRNAKFHEKQLAKERSDKAKEYNLKLKQRLQNLGKPPEKYGAKSYTLSVIHDMFKDPLFDIEDLPEDCKQSYIDWLTLDLPPYLKERVISLVESDMIRYDTLNRATLLKYSMYDIVYTLEILTKLIPVVKARNNEAGIAIEDKLIYPLFEMERIGFAADKEYLMQAKQAVKEYTLARRRVFESIVGEGTTIGQHAKIKEICKSKFGLDVPSTGSEVLGTVKSEIIHEHGKDFPAVAFIELLQELRTLEKWYATYIMRFVYELKTDERLYTTINQVDTVSGRVSSNFQQFPKKGIKTHDGQDLFCPRHIIKVSGGHNKALVYLDYSQIELRFQALYTVLTGQPDLNLCRAYMPYKCVRTTTSGEIIPFNYNNPEDIKQAYTIDWYLEEDINTKWIPTDVHGATTKAAFDIDETHPDYHALRYIGKRVNFAKLTVDKAS